MKRGTGSCAPTLANALAFSRLHPLSGSPKTFSHSLAPGWAAARLPRWEREPYMVLLSVGKLYLPLHLQLEAVSAAPANAPASLESNLAHQNAFQKASRCH